MMAITNDFAAFLKAQHLSQNTIIAYTQAKKLFESKYNEWNAENLEAFKCFLIANHCPQTVNQRILAVNKYLSFCGKSDLKLKLIKIQHKTFAENVISLSEYTHLKNCLLEDRDMLWYFMVWTMGATGARVSELLQIRVEDVFNGYVEILSKGNKTRPIYFPNALQLEMMEWSMNEGIQSGYLFRNNRGQVITARGFSYHLKTLAIKYGIDTRVVYPHSFRHMFAKAFLERNRDISMLADILGHESIETTQIYLRRTSREQRDLINSIVTW